MEIQHHKEEKGGMFYVSNETKKLAEMTYVWAGAEKMIIDHTSVDPSLKGQGVGKQLVNEAVLFAREKGIKILPLCPFAKAVFGKEPGFSDVLF